MQNQVYKLLTSPVDHLMPWGVLSSYAVYENYMCFVRYCVVAFVRIFFDHNLIIYKNKAKDVVSQILNLSLQP